MNLIAHFTQSLSRLDTGWVLLFLLALSVVSVIVMLERALFFRSIRADVRALSRELDQLLRQRRYHDAAARLRASPSAEAAIVLPGVLMADLGAAAAEKAIGGATALQRQRMERGLAFLATLGSNAPFVGLLGTVLGVIEAFRALGAPGPAEPAGRAASALAPQAIMTGISDALVATAVGLLVAIPAVAAYNGFTRRIQSTLAQSEALNDVLLAHLLGEARAEG